jgi:quinol monooxygenase YgiN
MLHVIAIVTAKPGKRAEILQAIRANLPAVRAEQGCIEYGPAIDADGIGPFQTLAGPETIFVIEKWADAAALKAHAAAPHMAAYAAKVKDLIAGRVIHVLSPAE